MQRTKCLHCLGGARGARNYLKFTALAASTIALVKVGNPVDVSLMTSLNGGAWQSYTTGNTLSLNEGDEIRWRATTVNNSMASNQNNYHNFVMTGQIAASGFVMSILDSTLHKRVLQGNNTLNALFKNCTSLVRAPRLGIDSFGGSAGCSYMFQGCTALVDVPALEIKQMGYQSCSFMFQGCTALVDAPILDGDINQGCYASMFQGCTALVDASTIKLKGTLSGSAFYNMFNGCSSLSRLPIFDLTIVNVPTYAFEAMFKDCTSLIDASAISLSGGELKGAREMFKGCTALKYPPTFNFINIGNHGLYQAFQNTALEYANTISISGDFANHAVGSCFSGCSRLTVGANLSMTTASDNQTWSYAYNGCSSLLSVSLDFPAVESAQWKANTFTYCLNGCNSLTDIYITWEAWPDAGMISGMFSWPNISGVTLHVKPTLDISSLTTYGIPASWVVVQDA